MVGVQNRVCTICGEEKLEGQVWFLVAESHWEDKLRILKWQDELADRKGMHRACCPAHVQELVTHWMTSGDLDFLLAPVDLMPAKRQPGRGSALPIVAETDTRGAHEIGELAVDRESVGRALNENPDSLLIILDELRDALEREMAGASARPESGAGMSSGWMRQM
ncbi:MAG TPA: hypothetical protein VEF05_02465 [Terriglobales bacterium]|nr:hypothetical protein [Terriglobales bacterium]